MTESNSAIPNQNNETQSEAGHKASFTRFVVKKFSKFSKLLFPKIKPQKNFDNKPAKPFRYVALAMQILEKILGTRFTIHGAEKINNELNKKHSVLFVANHFTRSETFFVPYLLFKATKRQVRCLADHHIFVGAFGKFLRSVGAISTKEKNRDEIIIRDLINGDYLWMIYPEGSMIKNKDIRQGELYTTNTPHRSGPVRTGSAVLALKSELYRQNLIEAHEKKDSEAIKDFKQNLTIEFNEKLREIQTVIIPVNITYYPIRPDENPLQKIISRLVKKIPAQIAEELRVEGNILLSANIDLSIGDPISMADYVKLTHHAISQIPIISQETKNNLILRYLRTRLSQEFMAKIYHDIQVNFDHLFTAAIWHFDDTKISINHLKRIIYYSAVLIEKTRKIRSHSSIFEQNLFKLFADEPHESFDSVFELALNQKIIELTSSSPFEITLNKSNLLKKSDFHEIRLENTLQVIANEFFLHNTSNNIVKKVVRIQDETLQELVFNEIKHRDFENFEIDYEQNFDLKFSKEKEIGRPFYLDSNCKASTKIQKLAVVAIHGYKAAPKEVEYLAKSLNGYGIRVYGVRLKGHGTSPIDMKEVSWQEWYESLQRGYCALNNIAQKIIFVGFSTGGLLSLLACAFKQNFHNKVAAIISINAALKLRNIKARMVPGITLWNELLEKFSIEKGKFEFVDDSPENPHINYSRNYLNGVHELEKLMEICSLNLERIATPALIIQAKEDSVVEPESGRIIFNRINSSKKFLQELDFNNHVIVTSNGKEEVFGEIVAFLSAVDLI